mmetsp:Transcript_9860/g.25372  ORF Transcript_9860/g.25372 Transcript_9860/m.25372 type:complete len:231 (+) Transcript_9860:763-1455(+)
MSSTATSSAPESATSWLHCSSSPENEAATADAICDSAVLLKLLRCPSRPPAPCSSTISCISMIRTADTSSEGLARARATKSRTTAHSRASTSLDVSFTFLKYICRSWMSPRCPPCALRALIATSATRVMLSSSASSRYASVSWLLLSSSRARLALAGMALMPSTSCTTRLRFVLTVDSAWILSWCSISRSHSAQRSMMAPKVARCAASAACARSSCSMPAFAASTWLWML